MLPLHGIRILDLTNVLAGPYCGYQLARMGAEVIKIENPRGGDLARSLGSDPAMARGGMGLSFVAVNAGKQSVALDLKTDGGKAAFLDLVKTSDAVLENFRPNVMQRLGLAYDMLSAVNPRLVYCAISGFGQSGPWAERPAYDQIVQGLAGVMSVTGDPQTAPLRAGFPLCDTLGGLTASFAIAAALVQQQRTGKGTFIDVSLLESTLSAMGWVVSNYLNAHTTPQPMGNENFTAAPSGTFRTGDGLLNISANEQRQFEHLCELIEMPDLASDPRFARRDDRKRNRVALRALIEQGLATRGCEAWESLLNDQGVPAGRVLSVPEVLAQPHLSHRNFVEPVSLETSSGGAMQITRPGFLLSEPFDAPTSPPVLGAHTRSWLQRLGRSQEEIDRLLADGAIGAPA